MFSPSKDVDMHDEDGGGQPEVEETQTNPHGFFNDTKSAVR